MTRVITGFGLFVILAVVIIFAALALTMYRLVRSRSHRAPALSDFDRLRAPDSNLAVCQRCGEQRIIVSAREGMCASCYSSMRTKTVA
jgi:Tfp pilus assembly protein PilX